MNFKIDEDGLMEFSREQVIGYAKVEIPMTEENIENIMVTAIEGGINYWGYLVKVGENWVDKPKNVPPSQWATKLLLEGKNVTIEELEEQEEHILTLEKVIKGFEQNYKERTWDNDIENGDAETASCIIQYALFGDVVYG